MEPPCDQVQLSQIAKDQLSKLKRSTKINQCHTLCRWGFCRSLAEPSVPANIPILQTSNLAITWYEFSGKFSDILSLALKQRCYNDGLSTDKDTLAKYWHLHLHRGIGYLAGDPNIKKIEDLVELAVRCAVR